MTTSHQPGSPGVDLNELEFSAERIESLVEGITVFGRIGDADKLARQALRAIDCAAELRTLRAQVDERVEEGARSLYEMHRREAVGALEAELRTLRARVGDLESENARLLDENEQQHSTLCDETNRAESAEARVVELEAMNRSQVDKLTAVERLLGAEADKLEERAESAEARVKELEAQYAAIAHAVGIEYAPDNGPTHPGPFEAVLAAVTDNTRKAGQRWELESQLAAAREEQGLLKSFEAMLIKRNAEHERYVELRLSIGVAFGDVSWKASDGEEFGPLPTLPALLRAILEVETRPGAGDGNASGGWLRQARLGARGDVGGEAVTLPRKGDRVRVTEVAWGEHGPELVGRELVIELDTLPLERTPGFVEFAEPVPGMLVKRSAVKVEILELAATDTETRECFGCEGKGWGWRSQNGEQFRARCSACLGTGRVPLGNLDGLTPEQCQALATEEQAGFARGMRRAVEIAERLCARDDAFYHLANEMKDAVEKEIADG